MTPEQIECRDKAAIQCILRDYVPDELAIELAKQILQQLKDHGVLTSPDHEGRCGRCGRVRCGP